MAGGWAGQGAALFEAARFMQENLPVTAVPLVPTIRLHKAGPASGLGRLAEIRGIAAGAPYWAYHWNGGVALARYLLDNPGLVAGRRVLDLGAGSGIVGIAAAMAGATDVLAADIDDLAITAVELNAALNRVSVRTVCRDLLDEAAPDADVVLAADLFYDETLARRTTGFLRRCLGAGADVLVGDPYRPFLPLPQLCMLAEYRVPDFGDARRMTPSGVFRLRP